MRPRGGGRQNTQNRKNATCLGLPGCRHATMSGADKAEILAKSCSTDWRRLLVVVRLDAVLTTGSFDIQQPSAATTDNKE